MTTLAAAGGVRRRRGENLRGHGRGLAGSFFLWGGRQPVKHNLVRATLGKPVLIVLNELKR